MAVQIASRFVRARFIRSKLTSQCLSTHKIASNVGRAWTSAQQSRSNYRKIDLSHDLSSHLLPIPKNSLKKEHDSPMME